MEFPDHPFWDFSIQVHRQSGVHEACLALQTRYRIDVNLLFYCCWVGAAGGGLLDEERVKTAMAAVNGWQEEIVRPIWKARWQLKPSYKNFSVERTEPLRRALIQAELEAEHIEQLHLAEAVAFTENPSLSKEIRATHAVANIFLFLKLFTKNESGPQIEKKHLITALPVLLSACFPDLGKPYFITLIENQT